MICFLRHLLILAFLGFPSLLSAAPLRVGVVSQCPRVAHVPAVASRYLKAVRSAGFEPIVVNWGGDEAAFTNSLNGIDAFLIPGGSGKQDFPLRRKLNNLVLTHARERRLPVLGICFGHQEINRFQGGSLRQAVPEDRSNKHNLHKMAKRHLRVKPHVIDIAPATWLSRATGYLRLRVNSSHIFAIDRVGRDLVVIARAPDGTIEAIAHRDLPWYGVQFHPEVFADESRFLNILKSALTPIQKK